MSPVVLLIDDDCEALTSLARALSRCELACTFHTASTPEKAKKAFLELNPHVVVLDLSLVPHEGVESGFSLLREFSALSSLTRVIILTGHGSTEHGIRALELGAAHFLQKPADLPHIKALIQDSIAQARLRIEMQQLKLRDTADAAIIGVSAASAQIREQLHYAAATDLPVVILGETGTGKGVCAREIHRLSARSSYKFIRYQPTFSTADLANSDLFGHAKGSFTGAQESRKGLLLEAHRGTFFLDEIDQLPLDTQVSLLGALQEREIRPVGANKSEKSDFRCIVATNADLSKLVEEGKFRRDLYYRIAHCTITLPPLRERREDIPQLAAHFLKEFSRKNRANLYAIDDEALALLSAHSWPGNIRELEAMVEGAAYHALFRNDRSLTREDFTSTPIGRSSSPSSPSLTVDKSFSAQVEEFKVRLIEEALKRHEGNQVQAALSLQMERSTLRRILLRK